MLPREIRDEIYQYLFLHPDIDISGNKLNPTVVEVAQHIPRTSLGLPLRTMNGGPAIPYTMLAPISRSCKQLYSETALFCIELCIYSIDDATTSEFFIRWLDSFGEDAWKSIRHLEFTDFARYEDGTDHRLISRCPNLQSLSLTLRDRSGTQDPNEAVWSPYDDTPPEKYLYPTLRHTRRQHLRYETATQIFEAAVWLWRIDLLRVVCPLNLPTLTLALPDVRDVCLRGMVYNLFNDMRYGAGNSKWWETGFNPWIETEFADDWPFLLDTASLAARLAAAAPADEDEDRE
jgi:hypothetical protein